MSKSYFLFLFLFSISSAYAKQDTAHFGKNVFYLEGFGNCGLYSLNYERIIKYRKKYSISPRVNLEVLHLKQNEIRIYGGPSILLCRQLSKHNHCELGIGQTLQYFENLHKIRWFYSGSFGFRSYIGRKELFFFAIRYYRFFGSEFYNSNDRYFIKNWAGICLGIRI